MTFRQKQIHQSIIYLIPLAVNSVFPLVVISIFTRILTKEDFGLWGLVQVYGFFATGLANFGMLTAYERNYFQFRSDRLKSAQLLYSSLGFVMLNFIAVAGFTWGFRNFLAGIITGSAENGTILFFAFCGQFFHSILSYYLTYFKNSENAAQYTRHMVAFSLLNLGFAMLFVSWLRIGVIGLVYAQLAAGVFIFTRLTIKFFGMLSPSLNMSVLGQSISIAYPLTPRIFLGVIGSQFDKYMIGLLASIGGVGVYSIGQKVASAIFSFMTAIQNVFAPQVYQRMFDHGKDGGRLVGRYLTPFAYVCVAPALLVALFSEQIFSLLTPAAFHGAMDIVVLLSLYYSMLFFGKQPQLIYAKKTFMTSWLSFFSIGLNIAMNIPFIMKWGALGAAWATLLSGLISSVTHFAVSQYYYRIGWEYQKLMAIYGVLFVSAFSILILRMYSPGFHLRICVQGLSVTLYILIGIRLGVISQENFKHLFSGALFKTTKSAV